MLRRSILGAVVLFTFAIGCAKQPAALPTAAPAPSGVSAPPAVMPSPPSGTSPAAARPAPSPPSSGTTVRPNPRDFDRVADLADVYFDFDKFEITPAAAVTLDSNARWLQAHADHIMLIEGHCDERGTGEYNLVLGERRAKAAMNYLVSRGVASKRLTVVSYGEERPVCTAKQEVCWAKNRRASFLTKRM